MVIYPCKAYKILFTRCIMIRRRLNEKVDPLIDFKTYGIPYVYEKVGRIIVDVDSDDTVEEAYKKAEEILDAMSVEELERHSTYLPNSEEIDYEGDVKVW